ncbi:MAG: hypothetical protein AAFV87_04305 [Pseudomonadota bacterium]
MRSVYKITVPVAALVALAVALPAYAQPNSATYRKALSTSADVLATNARGVNASAITAAAICVETYATDDEVVRLAQDKGAVTDQTVALVGQIVKRYPTFICLDRAGVRGLRVH